MSLVFNYVQLKVSWMDKLTKAEKCHQIHVECSILSILVQSQTIYITSSIYVYRFRFQLIRTEKNKRKAKNTQRQHQCNYTYRPLHDKTFCIFLTSHIGSCRLLSYPYNDAVTFVFFVSLLFVSFMYMLLYSFIHSFIQL